MNFPTRARTALLGCLAACGALPLASHAQSTDIPPGWAVGLGVAAIKKPYAGYGTDKIVFPTLSYESERFRFVGTTADWKFANYGSLSFALRGRYSLGDGYSASDAAVFSGMHDRKAGFWLGGAVTYKSDLVRVSAEFLGDVSDYSKGQQARVDVAHDFRVGEFTLTPHVAATYEDKKYVGYYYGVGQDEATAGRPAYQGASTVNYQAGLRTTYLLGSRQILFLDLGATALGKEIRNSPLVSQKTMPTLAVGYLYRF